MKLINFLSWACIILMSAVIFPGFTSSDVTSLPASKPLRNTIMSSVQNNAGKAFTPPTFSLSEEPKTMASSMPLSMMNSTKSLVRPENEAVSLPTSTPAMPKITSEPTVQETDPKITIPKVTTALPAAKPLLADLRETEPIDTFPVADDLPKLRGSSPGNFLAPDKAQPAFPALAKPAAPFDEPKRSAAELAQEVGPKKSMIVEAETVASDIQMAQDEERPVEPGVLYQRKGYVGDEPATIAFNFEDASLTNLLSYIEVVHNIKFITEDIVVGAKDAKGAVVPTTGVAGHKISFRTNRNLTRKESWDLFLTFMHIAGLDVIPMTNDRFYRVVPLAKANNEPIPTYIGVDSDVLPDSDMIVRYVYFTRNVDPAKLQPLLKTMQGGSAKLDVYNELKGLIFTDRACSIKSLMQIVMELDKAALPEVVSVVKLKRANVDDVIKLLQTLQPKNPAGAAQPQKVWVQSKKESTLDYFPSDVTLVGDKRTNSLVVLGAARDVQRIEEFVSKYIDMAIDRSAPPIFTYRLQYTNASDILTVLNKIVPYGGTTPAGQVGGVRDGVKFFQKMNIVADSFTNSLIINATPEDYEALKPLIKDLDVPQKQVGIEVLIVQVKDADVKTLGAQISGPNGINSPVTNAGAFGPTFAQSASAQTSGIAPGTPIIVTAGQTGQDDFSIKSSLASLLGGNVLNEVGSVLVTFGRPIWAIFKVLKTITSTHVIANPFLVVTNNSTATITSGEERRQVSGEVVSAAGQTTRGFTPVQATLTVNIRPQINKGNIINMSIDIDNTLFAQADSSQSTAGNGATRDTKKINTTVSVANGETLVLGGIMSENYATSSNGVPFLEHIPVVGWFFKSKTRTVSRDHFMIFICPRLLDPVGDGAAVDHYTDYKLHEVQHHLDLIDENDWFASAKDPIQKAFFGSQNSPSLQQLYTGKNYDKRERLDGKIDDDKKSKKRSKKKSSTTKHRSQPLKKLKHTSAIDSLPSSRRNAISGSIQSTKGGY